MDPSSPVPPFEQLRAGIAARVADGRLPAGTRLATVRQMAADLGLAANTVAKAYRRLEEDGVVETRGRHGTFVGSSGTTTSEQVAALATDLARAARRQGLSLPETQRLVEDAWA